jgi:hypothetical protein
VSLAKEIYKSFWLWPQWQQHWFFLMEHVVRTLHVEALRWLAQRYNEIDETEALARTETAAESFIYHQ